MNQYQWVSTREESEIDGQTAIAKKRGGQLREQRQQCKEHKPPLEEGGKHANIPR